MVTKAEPQPETAHMRTEREVTHALANMIRGLGEIAPLSALAFSVARVQSYVEQSFDTISRLSQRAAAADRRITQLERELTRERRGMGDVQVRDREEKAVRSLETMRETFTGREDFESALGEVRLYIAALELQSSSLETSNKALQKETVDLIDSNVAFATALRRGEPTP